MIVLDRKKIIAGLAGALMLTTAPLAFAAEWSVPDAADPVYPGSEEKKEKSENIVTDESMAEDSTGDDEEQKETAEPADTAEDPAESEEEAAEAADPEEGEESSTEETAEETEDAEQNTAEEDTPEEDAAPPADDAAEAEEEVAEPEEEAAEAEEEAAEPEEEMAKPAEEETPAEADASTTAGCQKAIDDMLSGNPIEFLSGRFTLSDAGRDKVEKIAEMLKGCGESNAVIGGHTDSDGTEAINQRLSGKRAEEVMDLLVDMGIDKKRLRAVGYGQSQPLVENDTPENKALNRRIELKLY